MLSTRSPFGYSNTARGGADCPFCGEELRKADACRRCSAPMEVISSILLRDQPPKFISVLGPSGVGKTVYLGMQMDLLARGVGGLQGLSRGPYSLELHRNVITALERQRFPGKTPCEPDRWQWVDCEVHVGPRGPVYDIVTPDVAGESVQNELENTQSIPIIHGLISRCAGLVILLDLVEAIAGGSSQELFAIQLISKLASLRARSRRKVRVPVALVFTKADLCEELAEDIEAFVKSNARGLWNNCEARLERFRFFASAVAGSSARLVDSDGTERMVPLRVEPRGIVEPLAWLLQQLK